MQSMNYIITVYPSLSKHVPIALAVADAVFCAICQLQPLPLEAPCLD